jgi:hypothetical protein
MVVVLWWLWLLWCCGVVVLWHLFSSVVFIFLYFLVEFFFMFGWNFLLFYPFVVVLFWFFLPLFLLFYSFGCFSPFVGSTSLHHFPLCRSTIEEPFTKQK